MISDLKDGFEDASPVNVYSGAAWRARFLRGPKIANELASREDFAPLSNFANVKLGLKTGADDFFFVREYKRAQENEQLFHTKGAVTVKGFSNWIGEIARRDLLPAVLNPHRLFRGDVRVICVPNDNDTYYLYPTTPKPRFGLSQYLRLGELAGIHEKKLVSSNASEDGWYKQARNLVSSEWVLPYNSAYDYGAWYNPKRAVLNGRFVGVEPFDPDLSMLLGAVLNSTFAAFGRLIEGVATGVEGAFDVGPPAARRIMIPDLYRLQPNGGMVLEIMDRMLANDVMPGAPGPDGLVSRIRRELDTALLIALGATPGQAAGYLERLYRSYGRWRANISATEMKMRSNRKQMAQTGQSRDQQPAEAAGRRVWEELEHEMSLFPRDLLSDHEVLEVVHIPAAAVFPASRPLFDEGIISTKHKRIDLGSFERVRFAAMMRKIGVIGSMELPVSHLKAGAIADLFEEQQLHFERAATKNAKNYVSTRDGVVEVVESAMRHWLSACRRSALSDRKSKENKSLN